MRPRNKVGGRVDVELSQESMAMKINRGLIEFGGLVIFVFHLAGLVLVELDRLLRDTMSLRTALLLRNTLV